MLDRMSARCVCLALLIAGLGAAEYRIAPGGSDTTGDGSVAKPWATLDHALAATAGDASATYRFAAGTYVCGPALALRSGSTLVGAGRDATVLIADLRARGTTAFDGYAYTTASTIAGIAISDLTLAGAADDAAARRGRALDARDGTDLVVRNVRCTRYADGAFRLERWKRILIEESELTRTTYNTYLLDGRTPAQQSTAIEVADLEDVVLRWLTIDTREKGGRAIGSAKQRWEDVTDAYNWEPAALVRMEIAHCDLRVDQWHAWDTGAPNYSHPPQIAIELWHCYADSVRIHHNRINNNCSLASAAYKRYGTFQPPYGNPAQPVPAVTMRLDHNLFDLIPTASTYRYAVETYVPRLRFDHNVVFRGIYPFAAWGAGDQAGTVIHHNLFYGTGNTSGLIHNPRAMAGLRFVNNTVYAVSTQSTPLVNLPAGQAADQVVANNLFLSTIDQTHPVGFTTGAQANWSWRFAAVGTPVGSGDPLLHAAPAGVLTGTAGVDWTRFRLAAGSPGIDAGVAVGDETAEATGAAPDLGAFEAGAPWFVGPNRTPVITLPTTASGTAGQLIVLAGAVADDGLPVGGALTCRWSAPAGAGAVFTDPAVAATSVRIAHAGSWPLMLTASDGDASASATITVVVAIQPGDRAPVVATGAAAMPPVLVHP